MEDDEEEGAPEGGEANVAPAETSGPEEISSGPEEMRAPASQQSDLDSQLRDAGFVPEEDPLEKELHANGFVPEEDPLEKELRANGFVPEEEPRSGAKTALGGFLR